MKLNDFSKLSFNISGSYSQYEYWKTNLFLIEEIQKGTDMFINVCANAFTFVLGRVYQRHSIKCHRLNSVWPWAVAISIGRRSYIAHDFEIYSLIIWWIKLKTVPVRQQNHVHCKHANQFTLKFWCESSVHSHINKVHIVISFMSSECWKQDELFTVHDWMRATQTSSLSSF